MHSRSIVGIVLAWFVGWLSFILPTAATAFQNEATTLVVPTPAAGPLDMFARLLAPELTARWGKPVIVRNVAGSGTALGTQMVANAKPDGRTLLVANIAVSTHRALSDKPLFDVEKDLQPITLLATTPFYLLVPGDGPASWQELLDNARAQPGSITFGVIANSQQHLDTARLIKAAGIDAHLVPYQGTAPITIALLTNRIDAFLGSLGGIQGHLTDDRLRALAVTSAEPSKQHPEVPTFTSLGINFELEPWYAVFGPAGMSEETLNEVHDCIMHVMSQPSVIKQIEDGGYTPKTSSIAELKRLTTESVHRSFQDLREVDMRQQ